jgi:exosortase
MGMVGWKNYKRMCVPLLFLFLMLPLPGQIHDAIMLPLQAFCAQLAATVLETVGIPVQRYGHILEVYGQQTAVAEACNGLRMAVAFLVVTCVVAYLIDRPTWQKVVVLISCVPIALACNVVRIVVMAYSFGAGYGWWVEGLVHDGLGLLMMPLALSLVFLELALLSNLAVPSVQDPPLESGGPIPAFSGR